MDPKQEVAPVISDGEGEAEFTLRRDKVRFKLEWDDLTSDVLFAHIHCNVAGVNGPVGVTLIHEMMGDEGRVKGSFTGPDVAPTPVAGTVSVMCSGRWPRAVPMSTSTPLTIREERFEGRSRSTEPEGLQPLRAGQ